jgi:hypothetical protein
MRAHTAAPVFWIVIGARKQFTGTGRRDHRNGAIAPCLRLCGVEWHEDVDALARIGVHGREDRRPLCHVEIGLIDPDLRGVLRVSLLDPIALNRAPALVAERLVLPKTRIASTRARR